MFLLELTIYGLIHTLLEGLACGVCGYFLFRAIRKSTSHWYIEILVLIALLLAYWTWGYALLAELDISIGNEELVEFLDGDTSILTEMDAFDVLIALVEVLFGYWVGRKFYQFATRRGKHLDTAAAQ